MRVFTKTEKEQTGEWCQELLFLGRGTDFFSVPTSNVIMKTKSFEEKWRHTHAFCKFLAIFSQIIETVNLRVFIHLSTYLGHVLV